MKIHKFYKSPIESVYMFPVYVRDDHKYKIKSTDRCFGGKYRRVFEVVDATGKVVGTFPRFRDAKISFEAETV